MKSDGFLKHLIAASALALLLYAGLYAGIEHRRASKGPWRVTFTNDVSGAATIRIDEPKLGITNFQIVFPEQTNFRSPAVMVFNKPKAPPYDLPFGQCIFMDTTFLPGTIVFNLFDHEIQLIPRTLTADKTEIPWQSNTNVFLIATNSSPVK